MTDPRETLERMTKAFDVAWYDTTLSREDCMQAALKELVEMVRATRSYSCPEDDAYDVAEAILAITELEL